jgi:hypothetical protein
MCNIEWGHGSSDKECLLSSKFEALSSNPSTKKEKKKKSVTLDWNYCSSRSPALQIEKL